MHRKIFIVIMILCLVLTSQNAFAVQISDNIVTITVDCLSIPLTVNAIVYPLGVDHPDPEDIVGFDTRTFNIYGRHDMQIKLRDNLPTGEYIIKIFSGGDTTQSFTFPYASKEDVELALNYINRATAQNVAQVLQDNKVALGLSGLFSGSDFAALSQQGREIVYVGMVGQNFASATEVSQYFNDLIIKQFNIERDIAQMVDIIQQASTEDMAEIILQYADSLGFNLHDELGYKLLIDEESVYLNNLYGALAGKDYSDLQIYEAKERIKRDLDRQVLLAVFNQASASQLQNIFPYYAQQLPDYSTAQFSKLHVDDQIAVLKALAANYTFFSEEDIVEAFNKEVEKIAKDADGNQPRKNSASGSGGAGRLTLPAAIEPSPDLVDPIQQTGTTAPFKDIDSVPWALEAISHLKDEDIISGTGQDLFLPNNPITREEFVKLLVLALNVSNTKEDPVFEDVNPQMWSYQYIMSAYHEGIVFGKTETNFYPKDFITRQEISLMIYRAALSEVDMGNEDISVAFNDIELLSEEAKKAIKVLANSGIILGVGEGKFEPYRNATRAESAKIIYSMKKHLEGKSE